MLVRENIFLLRNDVMTVFPEKFENEIYKSSGRTDSDQDVINYVSNFSIKYVQNGEENYQINGKNRKVTSDKMLIVNDKSESSLISANANALSIFIDPQILNDCLDGINNSDKFLEEPFSNPKEPINFYEEVQNIDHELKYYFDRISKNADMQLCVDFFYELSEKIVLSQNRLQYQINKISSKKIATRRETFRRLEKAKEYIDANLHIPFNLDEVSKISCLSKYYLIRLFKEVYGITPNRYYLDRKLKKAAYCIKKEDNTDSLNEIATDFGFSDYTLFYKQFKKVYGFAPSQLKKIYS